MKSKLYRASLATVLGMAAMTGMLTITDSTSRASTLTQAPSKEQLQAKLVEVKASLAANQLALHQYTWVETTEMSLKGEVKSTQQKNCFYGADGKVAKTMITAPPEKKDARGIKGKIVDKKVGELTDYMERAQSLLGRYVPPDPESMQASFQAGKGELRLGAAGKTTLAFRDYAKPGDEFDLVFDSATKKIVSINVNSYLDDPKDDIVKLIVTFTSLPDGTNYLSGSVLNAAAKQVQVKVTNFGYRKASK